MILSYLTFSSADHVSAASGAGIRNASANCACRFCLQHVSTIATTRSGVAEKNRPVLRSVEHFKLLQDYVKTLREGGHGNGQLVEELLKQTGYLEGEVINIYCLTIANDYSSQHYSIYRPLNENGFESLTSATFMVSCLAWLSASCCIWDWFWVLAHA